MRFIFGEPIERIWGTCHCELSLWIAQPQESMMRRPQFIAEHARNARGLLGRLIAFIMARETWSQNLRTMDALGIE